MKKTLTTFAAIMALAMTTYAQYPYLETVPYKGAFAPAPTPMWTEGWTEWNPQTKAYPVSTVEISTNITTDMTLTNDKVYLLKNKVYVTNGAKLSIQAGTVIRGDKATEGTLIITKGSKIYAWGTKNNPIVFTSNFAAGARNPGDWGGVILLGNAVINQTTSVIEGGLDANLGSYGGTDDNDNSGIFQFVRIEFAGFPFAPDKEINGLTLGGVGRGTVIDHVQASYTNDDSFEWFGGNVTAKYLVAYAGTDDDFDTDFGFSGSVQFGLGLRDPNYSDQCTCSSSEGFESDNDGTGSTLTPITNARFANMTIIGPLKGNKTATVNAKFQRALRIRRNSALKIYNSVFMDWPKGLLLDGDKTEANAKNGILKFESNVIAGMAGNEVKATTITSFPTQTDVDAWFTAGGNTTLPTTAGLLTNPYVLDATVDFRPASGSPLLAGAKNVFTDATPDFVGAFAKAPTPMWSDGWAEWDPQNKTYPVSTVEISSDITTDMVLTSNNVYLLKNKVYVTNGATLTIQPGTVIRGDKATEGTLIISTTGKINAVGTATNPIVFTSNFAVGARNPGDWGGVIILGNATINQTTAVVEGGLDPVKASYGGSMDDDNSGLFQFVRIEFAGFPFAPDKEINGLTLGGVGRGTTIHHVQASFTNDDSFEWFGGYVNSKYLIAYRGVDDDFDTDFGFGGSVQFGLGLRDPNLSDQCTCSSSEGFESDNDGTGSNLNPRTSANFYNITDIGPLRGNPAGVVNAKFQRALRLRRNTQLNTYNSLFMDWPKGLLLDGAPSEGNAKNGVLKFQNNVIAGMAGNNVKATTTTVFLAQTDLDAWFGAGNNQVLATTAGILENPYPVDFTTGVDYRYKGLPVTILGTEETVVSSVTEAMLVYPNPATESVQVALSKNFSNATVSLQNALGTVVATQQVTTGVAKFDVNSLVNGLYIVTVKDGSSSLSKTVLINR